MPENNEDVYENVGGALERDVTMMKEETMEFLNERLQRIDAAFAVEAIRVRVYIPHPYLPSERLIQFAAKNHLDILAEGTILAAEYNGIGCAYEGCCVPYGAHKRVHVAVLKVLYPVEHGVILRQLQLIYPYFSGRGIDTIRFTTEEPGTMIIPKSREESPDNAQKA